LNQTVAPVLPSISSEPVKPGIKMTGGLPCAFAHKTATAKNTKAAAKYAIFLGLAIFETPVLLNFLNLT
jgi:hypothetical protein